MYRRHYYIIACSCGLHVGLKLDCDLVIACPGESMIVYFLMVECWIFLFKVVVVSPCKPSLYCLWVEIGWVWLKPAVIFSFSIFDDRTELLDNSSMQVLFTSHSIHPAPQILLAASLILFSSPSSSYIAKIYYKYLHDLFYPLTHATLVECLWRPSPHSWIGWNERPPSSQVAQAVMNPSPIGS